MRKLHLRNSIVMAFALSACTQRDRQAENKADSSPVAATADEVRPVDRSDQATAQKVNVDSPSAIETRMVVVEDDPTVPQDPTLKCEWPQRLHNRNGIKVSVSYKLHYRGNATPGCNASWSQDQPPVILTKDGTAGSTFYVGCAVHHLPGGTCTEYRNWEVIRAVPAR
jgi:hypothetical protein